MSASLSWMAEHQHVKLSLLGLWLLAPYLLAMNYIWGTSKWAPLLGPESGPIFGATVRGGRGSVVGGEASPWFPVLPSPPPFLLPPSLPLILYVHVVLFFVFYKRGGRALKKGLIILKAGFR